MGLVSKALWDSLLIWSQQGRAIPKLLIWRRIENSPVCGKVLLIIEVCNGIRWHLLQKESKVSLRYEIKVGKAFGELS